MYCSVFATVHSPCAMRPMTRRRSASSRQLQQRAGVALGQVVFAQRLQDRRRMAQDAQLVGDGGLALADAAGGLLLAQVVLLHELLQTLGLFDVVEIPAL